MDQGKNACVYILSLSFCLLWTELLAYSFPDGSGVNETTAGDPGSIPGLGRSPGEGNGNPLQYVCLENPMDRGVWWATVNGVTNSQA